MNLFNRSVIFCCILCASQISVAVALAPEQLPLSERVARLERALSLGERDVNAGADVQQLQEDLQSLRGLIETLAHHVDQIEQRERELYADVDRRIGLLSARDEAPALAAESAIAVPLKIAAEIEKTQYTSAEELLQKKSMQEAVEAFEAYLREYPSGQYVVNSYYSLGEIFLAQKHLEAARNAFQTVCNNYPTHGKARDALLKLGYVYEAEGNVVEAIKTFQQVKQVYPDSTVARLAESRLLYLKQL